MGQWFYPITFSLSSGKGIRTYDLGSEVKEWPIFGPYVGKIIKIITIQLLGLNSQHNDHEF